MMVKKHHNLTISELVEKAVKNKEALSSRTGPIIVYTGKYTGRSPKDKFFVDVPSIHKMIDWGKINQSFTEKKFEKLYRKVTGYLEKQKELFIFDGYVSADRKHQINVRLVSQSAHQALLASHLFRRIKKKDLKKHRPQFTIYSAPNYLANPKKDGTNSETFIIINLKKMIAIVGSTKYGGEIKKIVFSVMNIILPQKGVFPMHCSANIGKDNQTALFFGLSGTGKTTLSSDPGRQLIGDDEHGWSKDGIFNIEGGCYAKCIGLNKETDPQIWNAIRHGTILENVVLKDNVPDFADSSITENIRAIFPINYIPNVNLRGLGPHPKYILFLGADAFGILPPVAKLSLNSALFYFISGYTAKLAGTERGIKEPKATFSRFFAAPFMPLKPQIYLNLFEKYVKKYKTKIYFINTGWTKGPYGVGHRIKLGHTKKIVEQILKGALDKGKYKHNNLFNFDVPLNVSGVPRTILDPKRTWKNKKFYDKKAKSLAKLFIKNIRKYKNINQKIINAGPKI